VVEELLDGDLVAVRIVGEELRDLVGRAQRAPLLEEQHRRGGEHLRQRGEVKRESTVFGTFSS